MRKYAIDFLDAEDILAITLDRKEKPLIAIRRMQMPDEFTEYEVDVLGWLAHQVHLLNKLPMSEGGLRSGEALRHIFRANDRVPKKVRDAVGVEYLRQMGLQAMRKMLLTRPIEDAPKKRIEKRLAFQIWDSWPFRYGQSSWHNTQNKVTVEITTRWVGVHVNFDTNTVWHKKHGWSAKSYFWGFKVSPLYCNVRIEKRKLIFRHRKIGKEVTFVQSRGMDLRRML